MGDIDLAWLGLLFGLTGIGALGAVVLRVIGRARGGFR